MDNANGNKIEVMGKPEIVVHGEATKPYFEIKYHEVGKPHDDIGFSSYSIENVFKWLENEFVVIEADEQKASDVVREPQHYQHGIFEVIDEMIIVFGVEATMQFCIMNAWKYRKRAPFKGNPEQDLEKADCYLEMAKKIAETNMSYISPFTLIKEAKEE